MNARHGWSRGWLLVMVAVGGVLGIGGPARSQSPDDAAGRVIPTADLLGYLEWTGLEAHPEAWKKTAVARLLSETKLGSALESLLRQTLKLGVDQIPAEAMPGEGLSAERIQRLVGDLMDHGLILAMSGRPDEDPQPRVTVVVREVSEDLRTLIEGMVSQGREPEEVEHAGRAMKRLGGRQPMYWWMEGGDLVAHVAASDDDLAFVDRLDKQGEGEGIEARRELGRADSNGFQPVLFGWFDMRPLRDELPPEAERLGLNGLGKIDFRWGFEGEALRTIARIGTEGERTGMLTLMDQPAFATREVLKVVPKEATDFTVMSLDLAGMYDRVLEVAKSAEPDQADEIEAGFGQLDRLVGVPVRDEILKHLGPMMMVRVGGGEAVKLPRTPLPLLVIPEVLMTAEVRDPGGLRESLDRMMPMLNGHLAAPDGPGATIEKREDGGYLLRLPPELMPQTLRLTPTLLVGKTTMAMASNEEAGEAALAAIDGGGSGWKAEGEYAEALGTLPSEVIMMGVSDPRGTVPELIAGLPRMLTFLSEAIGAARAAAARESGEAVEPLELPRLRQNEVPTADEVRPYLFPAVWTVSVDETGLRYDSRESVPGISSPATVGVAVALLLPAVQAAREAARRTQCMNNEKQMMLALLNYESANGRFPAAAITDADGTPLLSWRVAILPYIEEQALYERFRLDEPWDSEHNKALLELIPSVYVCPSNPAGAGMTAYRVATGDDTAFPMTKGRQLAEIRDGTSNTLGVIEAAEMVPWTQPDEMPLVEDAAAMSEVLGSNHPGGINAAFLDGSVRFLKATIDPRLIRALFTPNGGEVIDRRALDGDPPPARAAAPPRRRAAAPGGGDERPQALLPAVQGAREAARRAQCTNHLKMMMLAMHNYHDAYNRFPAGAITDQEGTPLLSWRVAILPYLEQQALYEQFRMNEPWDSPHNRALLKEMPIEFACPSGKLDEGMTCYKALAGPGLGLDLEHGTQLREFIDGTSYTLTIVESTEAVPWTKPEEPLTPEALGAMVGSAHGEGYNAAFADGSVRFLPDDLEEWVLKALSTRGGGEAIPRRALEPKVGR